MYLTYFDNDNELSITLNIYHTHHQNIIDYHPILTL